MSLESSEDAHKFVKLVIESFERTLKSSQSAEKCPQFLNRATDAGEIQKHTRRVCDIDYAKFDDLAESLEQEERRQIAENKSAAADCRKMMAGCAHDHSKERQLYEKPTKEKLHAAERFRTQGNECYKDKNFGLAAVQYRKALLQFDYTFPETAEETSWLNREKLAAHLNMAACKLKQREWEEALTQCRLALELDARNCKAYYRRGLIYLELDNFEKAATELASALAIEPKDSAILTAIQDTQLKSAQYKKKSKEMMAAMAGKKPAISLPVNHEISTAAPPILNALISTESQEKSMDESNLTVSNEISTLRTNELLDISTNKNEISADCQESEFSQPSMMTCLKGLTEKRIRGRTALSNDKNYSNIKYKNKRDFHKWRCSSTLLWAIIFTILFLNFIGFLSLSFSYSLKEDAQLYLNARQALQYFTIAIIITLFGILGVIILF